MSRNNNRKMAAAVISAIMLLEGGAAYARIDDNEIAGFLFSADIIKTVTEFDGVDAVSRGDFAIEAVRVLGIGDNINIFPDGIFADVPADNKAFNAVNMLYCLGFINGADDYCFEPNRPIKIDEAAKIIVNVMGYTNRVENNDYLGQLNKNRLLSGVDINSDRTISGKAMEKLIYNLLEFELDTDNHWDITIDGKRRNLYMSERLGIYKTDGIVTDNGITSLYGTSDIGDGKIKIGDMVFNNLTGHDDLLGYNIEVYYKEDKNGEKNLIFASYANNSNKVLEIDADDIVGYDSNTYTYYQKDGDKRRTVTVSGGFNLIYNNRAYSTDTVADPSEFKEIMMPEYGHVRLINSGTGNGYDTVIIKSYDCAAVGSVDSDNKLITGRVPVKRTDALGNVSYTYEVYDLSKADAISIKSSNGYKMELSSVLQNNIAAIALSIDKTYAEIIVSAETAEGKIERIQDDKCTIDGKELEYSEKCKEFLEYRKKNNKSVPQVGDECTFYLNSFGKIEYFKTRDKNAAMFAYLSDAAKVNSGFEDTVKLKLVLQDKQIRECVVSENAEVDGRKNVDMQELFNKLSAVGTGGFKGKIIRVKINDKDEVTFIDTPYYSADGNPNSAYESDDSLHIVSSLGEGEKRWYSFSGSSFEGKIATDTDTLMYVVPTKDDDPKQILVTDFQTTYKSNMWRYPTAYKVERDSMIADLIVMSEGSSGIDIYNSDTTELCPPYIVKEVSTALDDEGNRVIQFKLTQGSGEIIKYGKSLNADKYVHTDGKAYEITPGDIIQFGYDKNGKIDDGNIRILYDSETGDHLFTRVTGETDDFATRVNKRSIELYAGYINRITAANFELALKDPSAGTIEDSDKIIFSTASAYILKLDKNRGRRLDLAKSSDLIDFETGGNSRSKVAVYSSSGIVKFILIYE